VPVPSVNVGFYGVATDKNSPVGYTIHRVDGGGGGATKPFARYQNSMLKNTFAGVCLKLITLSSHTCDTSECLAALLPKVRVKFYTSESPIWLVNLINN